MVSARLKELLYERGWSLQQLAEIADLPMETVRNVYYGKTNDPKVSTVMKMAKAFNLSVNCMMGQCNHSPQERLLLQNYRACGPHGKSIIEVVARYEATAAKADREAPGKHQIPCLVPRGDVRGGIVYENSEVTYIDTVIDEAYIAVAIPNNDLLPVYCKDDILLFENRFPRNGEYAAFYKTDRAYIRKYVEEDGQYRLKCLHSEGTDIVLKRMNEIEYIGTCIGVVRT